MKYALILATLMAGAAIADTYVQGHVRSDGTYVAPHYRTDSDSTKMNNYSTHGNANPYTGQTGYVDPYKQPAPTPYYANPYETKKRH